MRDCAGKARFTLVELLVVIAIISILASMLMPVLRKAVEQGRLASCLNQQRGVGMAMHTYADAYNGFLPPYFYNFSPAYSFWAERLVLDSAVTPAVFVCPSLGSSSNSAALKATTAEQVKASPKKSIFRYVSYGMSMAFRNGSTPTGDLPATPSLFSVKRPSRLFLTMDSFNTSTPEHGGYLMSDHYVASPNVTWSMVDNRHNGSACILYGDGHVGASIAAPRMTKYDYNASYNPYLFTPFSNADAWTP